MSQAFDRAHWLRLPLPLAQVYARAERADNPNSAHNRLCNLLEALIKLGVAPLVIAYLDAAEASGSRIKSVDDLLLGGICCQTAGPRRPGRTWPW